MATSELNLYIDKDSPQVRLLAFPIIMKPKENGIRELQPQLRTQYLGDITGGKKSAIFVNCYGFVEDHGGRDSGFSPISEESKGSTVTAACITLGSIEYDSDIKEVAKACYNLQVSVRMSADSTQKVVYTINAKPALLFSSRVVRAGGCVVAAEGAIKCPEKMTSDRLYKFRVMFVSLTFLHRSSLFKVSRTVLSMRNSALIAVQAEVKLGFDLPLDHPMAKYLSKEDGQLFATVWVHLCNFKRTDRRGVDRSVENIRNKVRAMGLKLTLCDLWGPTLVCEATGKMSKYALGFFSETKVGCHPIWKCNSTVAKIMWSCTTWIASAKAIIQASSARALLTSEDIEAKGAISTDKKKTDGFNPFIKTAK